MNVSSRYWSRFYANDCVFSRNEQQKVYKPQGIYGPPAEEGSVSRALADVFEKNEKKNKTTSV